MDPFSHIVIGVGMAALSGQPLTMDNPIYLGAALGALVPDLDIIFQVKGDVVYLKNHRGFSHSLPGILLSSILITGALLLYYPASTFLSIFAGVFVGAFSHIFFDICNSYGAQILAPWTTRKYTLNLIQIFDPVLLFTFGGMIWSSAKEYSYALHFSACLVVYLLFRWWMKSYLTKRVASYYQDEQIRRLILLPAVVGMFRWDYLLETPGKNLVGQVRLFSTNITTSHKMPKAEMNDAIIIALESMIGELFKEFTPYFHVSYYVEETKHIIRFFDLRYLIKKEFMHSATVVLDAKKELEEAVFHPYNTKRNIHLN